MFDKIFYLGEGIHTILFCFVYRMMWAAGTLASLSSLSYPAISALISCNADSDQQGKYIYWSTFRYLR